MCVSVNYLDHVLALWCEKDGCSVIDVGVIGMQSNQSPLPDPLAGYEWDGLLVERKHEHAIHRLLGLYNYTDVLAREYSLSK